MLCASFYVLSMAVEDYFLTAFFIYKNRKVISSIHRLLLYFRYYVSEVIGCKKILMSK